MKLTRKKALELHRKMWSDMKESLGDCPSWQDRFDFKERWCLEHTPEHIPENNCYLCEYTSQIGASCESCPIDWSSEQRRCKCIDGRVNYHSSPISVILELPERKKEN